ncbi:hypothetical protein Q9L58_000268 [Maublancomyces gigas]|uniref:Uncharacterized protein n=1 Tax=Discina gigas TaxID=1032678 RepID=A0ABR3GXF3_9PEZI
MVVSVLGQAVVAVLGQAVVSVVVSVLGQAGVAGLVSAVVSVVVSGVDDPLDDDEDIKFLLSVPPDLLTDGNRQIAPYGFTLRELLAFMCFRAFGSVFELRTAPVPGSGAAISLSTRTPTRWSWWWWKWRIA